MGRNKNIKTNTIATATTATATATVIATNNNGNTSVNSTPLKIPKESKLQAKKLKAGEKYKPQKLTKAKLKKSKLEVQSNTEALLRFREKFITNLSNCIHQFEQDCIHDYQYKLKEIDSQLKLIHENPSKVFSEKFEQIGQLRDYKIYRDELDKTYKLREIEEEYKNLLIKAEKNYQNENETVRKRLLGYVQDKRTRLRDEMNNMEISEEYTVEIPNRNHPQTRRSKRKEEELTISYNKVPKVELNPKLFTLRQDQVSEDFDIFYNGNGQQMLGKRRNLRNGKKQQ